MCPKLTELLSWNGPTVHVCCFMLARTSTETFVSRVQNTAKKIFVSRKIRQQGHSLAEVSPYQSKEQNLNRPGPAKKKIIWISYNFLEQTHDFLPLGGTNFCVSILLNRVQSAAITWITVWLLHGLLYNIHLVLTAHQLNNCLHQPQSKHNLLECG